MFDILKSKFVLELVATWNSKKCGLGIQICGKFWNINMKWSCPKM